MKRTALTQIHEALGAKIAPFAGYNMPIEYTGINDEHITCREKMVVFDVSHMGVFFMEGPKASNFLQKLTSNDVHALNDGRLQYTCFTNETGGIIDDFLIYRFNSEKFMLVVNAANMEKDWTWCEKHAKEMGLKIGEELINASDQYCILAVQGPYAMKAMQKLTSTNIMDMEYYSMQTLEFAGISDALIATTGYTGASGCELYVKSADAEKLWNAVMEAGAEFGVKPAGLGARDTLRLEMGYCLYGNDIDDSTSPLEAGLAWITKFVDGNDFVNRDYHEKLKAEGVSKRLCAFELIDRGIPRQHYPVVDAEGNTIGEVTSGTMSPMMKKGIGMAYLNRGFWKEGTEIFIDVRGRKLKAQVVKAPMFKEQIPMVK
ncbi:MAG: glycine cleavage system aminomethyltransferase GcvT [Bacteroidales bacterium]|nr:glycine cleavage system aminomethyltransferase GcvT [Bacteroidales bacterium]